MKIVGCVVVMLLAVIPSYAQKKSSINNTDEIEKIVRMVCDRSDIELIRPYVSTDDDVWFVMCDNQQHNFWDVLKLRQKNKATGNGNGMYESLNGGVMIWHSQNANYATAIVETTLFVKNAVSGQRTNIICFAHEDGRWKIRSWHFTATNCKYKD